MLTYLNLVCSLKILKKAMIGMVKKLLPKFIYFFLKRIYESIIDLVFFIFGRTLSLLIKKEPEYNIQFKKLLLNLKITPSSFTFIRLGGMKDGGYIVPSIIEKTEILISVGFDNKCEFETNFLQLKKNAEVYIFEKEKINKKNNKKFVNKIKFINKAISSYTDRNYLSLNDFKKIKKILSFQIDCEGDEYAIINNLDQKILSRTVVFVIEIHLSELINSTTGLKIINNFLDKLKLTHNVMHLHPNNSLRNYYINGISFPRNIEATFVHKKYYKYGKKNKIQIPHKLDVKNHPKSDVVLPKILYK